jgi:predicted AAA+ superfamily ATPase
MIPRTLEKTIQSAIKTFPAVLVTGPRQSGKTTLLRERFGQSHRFISLEDPDLRRLILEDPRGFLRDNPPPIILDEIQHIPDLLHYIKSAIDLDRRPGQWLLSGSQSFSLMQGVSQSLSGRVAVLSLLPLSFGESRGAGKSPADLEAILERLFVNPTVSPRKKPPSPMVPLENWVLRGGYPEIRLNPEVNRQIWMAGYIQTYLERDVRQIVNIGDLNTFHRFLRLMAARTGQILNMSDLSRDLGMSVPTIKKWISILEASCQIFLLPPHFNNLGKRMIKSPMVYFLDTGIASYLMGIHSEEPLRKGPMMGALFETLVVSEWVKAFYHRGEHPELYYWRSKTGLEVDLLLDRNGRLYPLEIKATATLLPGHAEALLKWKELAGEFAEGGVLVADIDHPFTFKDLKAVPWWSGLD